LLIATAKLFTARGLVMSPDDEQDVSMRAMK
jgi:hypothetical protein